MSSRSGPPRTPQAAFTIDLSYDDVDNGEILALPRAQSGRLASRNGGTSNDIQALGRKRKLNTAASTDLTSSPVGINGSDAKLESPRSFLRKSTPTTSSGANSSSVGMLSKLEELKVKCKENITCSVCMEFLHRPVCLVPCSHVVCGACLAQWRKQGKHTCVYCRQSVSLVMDAPKNLAAMMDEYFVLFPEEKRSDQSVKEANAIDNLQRGVQLGKPSAPGLAQPMQQQRALTMQEAVQRFTEITGATVPVSRMYVEIARSQGYSIQHAINSYLEGNGANNLTYLTH